MREVSRGIPDGRKTEGKALYPPRTARSNLHAAQSLREVPGDTPEPEQPPDLLQSTLLDLVNSVARTIRVGRNVFAA
jgi:hypothetical protein